MEVEEISQDQYLDAIASSNVEARLDLGPVLVVTTTDSKNRPVVLINSAEGKHAKITKRSN